MRKYIILSFLFFFVFSSLSSAQDSSKKSTNDESSLVQFSGMVLTADSLQVIPYVNIITTRNKKGTYSDFNGYFNFVAQKGDTIAFKCIGFKESTFVIPDTLSTNKYSMVKLLSVDTFYLDVAVIRPLPLREMFDYYFVNADIPDSDMERARKNLERERLKESYTSLPQDGAEAGKYSLARKAQTYYYAGQIPPNTLLNPFAWGQFFEAWKRGDFKAKDKKLYDSGKD